VHLVATHGARLLPRYRFDPRSGLWRHHDEAAPPTSLHRISYDAEGQLRHPGGGRRRVPDSALAEYLRHGQAILAADPGAGIRSGGDQRAAAPSPTASIDCVGSSCPTNAWLRTI
jgi:hypothetical protein